MKAVIVEVDNKYAVALDKNGSFVKMKNNGRMRIGYEVDLPSVTGFNTRTVTRIASAAAVLLFSVGIGWGAYSYYQPYSYVDIDINPSIELTANRFDRVIKVEGINNDGENLLKKVSCDNKSIKAGIQDILKAAVQDGYLKEESADNAVMLTVSSKNNSKADQIENKIEASIPKELNDVKVDSNVVIEKVTSQKREDARKQGLSPGKLMLIEKLETDYPQDKLNEYKDKPVKDIIKAIQAAEKVNGKAGKQKDKVDKDKVNQGKQEYKDNQDEQPDSTTAVKPGNGRQKNDKGNNGSKASGNSGNSKDDKKNGKLQEKQNEKNIRDGYQDGNQDKSRDDNGRLDSKSDKKGKDKTNDRENPGHDKKNEQKD